eukprot:425213-Alexandrium_andersonii.AAC.1
MAKAEKKPTPPTLGRAFPTSRHCDASLSRAWKWQTSRTPRFRRCALIKSANAKWVSANGWRLFL